MRWWKRCGAALVWAWVAVAQAEWVELSASRDVWLSGAIASETDTNMGKTDRLKLKVWQELAIVDFDVAAAKSRQVVAAELWLRPVGQARVGQQRGTDLNWITVSTVSGEWVEGLGQRSYRQDPKGHGATFNEASFGRRAWAWPGSKVFDVILGNGQTFRYDGRLQPAGDGWFKMSIPVRFVHALVAGASHGLAILDGSTSPAQNAYIASRESGQGPYLRVQLGEPDEVAPRPPGELKVAPAPMAATPRHGAVQVRFRRPADAAAYHVRIDGQVVARWQIPYPRAEGSLEQFEIVDLPAGKQIKLEVAVADAAGNVSPFVSATGQTSAALSVPVLPASDWRPKGGPARISGGRLRVWALPAIVKVDPIRGGVLGESARPRFDQANAVWDAAEGLIRLVAARGEIVSFQLAIEAKRGRLSGVGVKVSPLRGPAGAIARRNVRLFRNWYVRAGGVWHSEYAVPLRGRFDIPTSDNGIRAQRLQAVTVDVHVPRQARAGRYDGRVSVEAAGLKPLELGLRVVVYDVVIPDELNFNPELNCYRGPAEAGTKRFFEAHRLAHYHRCTINRVPYSQSGKVHADMIPKIAGRGKDLRVVDWSGYDRRVGPILDGSAFRENPRAGVPVKTFYLPFFENWPASIHEHYHPGAPTSGPDWKMRHDLLAKPIEEAFDQQYKDALVAITRQFVEHFEQKGYTRTLVEMYLNNKPRKQRMVSTAWTLDEPVEYLDWAALRFFSRLFHRGIAGQRNTQFVFRGDISRPQWQGELMDGLMEIMYCNSRQFAMPRLMAARKRKMPTILYCYGSCNPLTRKQGQREVAVSNYESAAWCLKAYVHECDGVLPWQSLGGDGSLERPDVNGLIVDGRRFGVAAVASFRVFALRRGAQDVELLRQLVAREGWSRAQAGLLVAQKVPLGGRFKQRFVDEAAAMAFGRISAQGFVELKEGLLKLLAR